MIVKVNAFLESLAISNPLVIGGYSWGDFYKKWSSGEAKYPHLNAFSATKSLSKGATTVDLTLSMCDIVRNDESNLFEVENSTLNALRDIVNLFKIEMGEQNITINELASLTFFQNNGGDNVAGHYLTLNLSAYDDQSICTNLMGVGSWIPPTNQCEGATVVNSDATYFQLIPSGASYILPDNMVTDSDGTVMLIPAQTPFVCTPQIAPPDSPISIAGTYISDLPSGDSLNIITTDQNDVVISPISGTVSGGVATVVLPDETYDIYVNGVLNTNFTAQAMEDLTINITA